MIIGMMAAQVRAVSAGSVLWTPLNMEAVPQIYLDAQDSVITDVSGACSAISNLGAMGANGNFLQATAANRPTIVEAALNGKRVLSFDGANDVLTTASFEARDVFKNVGAAWVFGVYKKRTLDAAPTGRYLLFSATPSGAVRFGALTGGGKPGQANKPTMFARQLDAGALATLAGADVVQGSYAMALHLAWFASRVGSIAVNGNSAAYSATLTAIAGNTSDTAAGGNLSVGAFNSGTYASDVDIAAVVASNTVISAADQQRLEGWAAHKYGLTASLPAGHPYKTAAPTV